LAGEPPPPFLPPPPPNISRELKRVFSGFLRWESTYDQLDIGSYIEP
jgi:hypothetical protein